MLFVFTRAQMTKGNSIRAGAALVFITQRYYRVSIAAIDGNCNGMLL
jgi:hypothetical protein